MNTYTIPIAYDGFRIDKALAEISLISRSQIQNFLEQSLISCNGEIVESPKKKVFDGDTISIKKSEIASTNTLTPWDCPLDIIFEDEYLLVINKPAEMVVHPAVGNYEKTLVNAVLFHCANISEVGNLERPGIVHRLDKDTSGLIIVAKTNEAHAELSKQFLPSEINSRDEAKLLEKKIKRIYYALVYGSFDKLEGIIETKIARHKIDRQKMTVVSDKANNGKIAITKYETKKIWEFDKKNKLSLVKFELFTGRTHQIRVHCKFMKTPIVGDQTYGIGPVPKNYPQEILAFKRQALHAKEIYFTHPITQEKIELTCDFPEDVESLLEYLD